MSHFFQFIRFSIRLTQKTHFFLFFSLYFFSSGVVYFRLPSFLWQRCFALLTIIRITNRPFTQLFPKYQQFTCILVKKWYFGLILFTHFPLIFALFSPLLSAAFPALFCLYHILCLATSLVEKILIFFYIIIFFVSIFY